MRAFVVAWRAIVALYNELFFLLGVNLLWWVTGGIFVAFSALWGWSLLSVGGPWWIAPLAALPAGPATAALAVVTRRCARELHVDRSYYFLGLKTFWRKALALSAIGTVGLTLFGLNLVFYFAQQNPLLQALAVLWAYLSLLWLSVQLYVYPILVSMERPAVLAALRLGVAAALANPLFSFMLIVVAGALTGLSILLPILLPLVWPALISLLGVQSLRLFLQRAGVKTED
ncbi:MAG: hypothetical protein N2204_03540 [Anaerolineae bacterium]|nr:hypothetical protein [Anaerolineae bacterium]